MLGYVLITLPVIHSRLGLDLFGQKHQVSYLQIALVVPPFLSGVSPKCPRRGRLRIGRICIFFFLGGVLLELRSRGHLSLVVYSENRSVLLAF